MARHKRSKRHLESVQGVGHTMFCDVCHIDILKRNWFKHTKGGRHRGMENFLRPPLKEVNTF